MLEAPRSPGLRRALVAAVVAVHIAYAVAPADVLAPVDPWRVGRWIWEGRLPYRDFAFEYPPGAGLAFLLPGAVPRAMAPSMLALQAVAAELFVIVVVLRRFPAALWRWLPLSMLIFPFLSGGFDALPMAAIAASTLLIATGQGGGWWLAAFGTLIKLSPGTAWVWGRRALRPALAALAVTVPLLLAPVALARDPDDTYIGFSLHRGVQVESVAATTTWLGRHLTGGQPVYAYRFKSFEIDGAAWAATAWGVAGLTGLVLVAARARSADPWLASFTTVVLLLLASKVLSPQFVAWPAPLAAVLGGGWLRAWLAVAALTALAYAGRGPGWILTFAALRNALLVAVAVAALTQLVRRSSDGAGQSSSSEGFRPPT
jgi:hypothetical protein